MLAALACLIAVAFAAPASAGGGTTPPPIASGDSLVQLCYHDLGSTINTPLYAVCRGLQALTSSVAAACRAPLRNLPNKGAADSCAYVDGRRVSKAQLTAYRHSSVHRGLRLQRRLDARSPLYEETFAGTHNSFNASSYFVPTNGHSAAYYPTLTNQDPNQVFSITDQLRMDIRGIEVDLHWVPSLAGTAKTGGYWVDVCHGQSTALPDGKTVHVGCTIDRTFQNTLGEIRHWLSNHQRQFLLIYLENQLDGSVQGHNIAASLIKQRLGHLVYQPRGHRAPGHCASMPYQTSRQQMAATGTRVLLVGNCGPGNWNHWVFTRGDKWNEGGNPTTYGAADCKADEAARETHSVFRRWYEESPFLEVLMSASQTLTAATTKRMVGCGVNLTGWDQLTPNDGRLRAFLWSWGDGQPAAGNCAYQATDGRFRTAPCTRRFRFACVDHHLDWHVTTAAGPAGRGPAACGEEFPGSRFGVPPNGYRNRQLDAAKPHRHGRVWLDYARARGTWRPDPAHRYLR